MDLSTPTCPNDPCRSRELKLHREKDDCWVFVCPSCHMTSVRSKQNVSAKARWVLRMEAQAQAEAAERAHERRTRYFT